MPNQSRPLSLVPVTSTGTARTGHHERASIVGCGWFDSSWDLRLGLEVRETLPADVRLLDWIDAFLGAQAPLVALPSSITAIA